jgi:hypothetical protein
VTKRRLERSDAAKAWHAKAEVVWVDARPNDVLRMVAAIAWAIREADDQSEQAANCQGDRAVAGVLVLSGPLRVYRN